MSQTRIVDTGKKCQCGGQIYRMITPEKGRVRTRKRLVCKGPCGQAFRKAQYQKYRARLLAGVKSRQRKLKQMVIDGYGGKCRCCGEDRFEFMTVDHIYNDGAEHRRSLGFTRGSSGGMKFYRWIINNDFPNNLQLLCWNCNCAKAHFGRCPHEVERTTT